MIVIAYQVIGTLAYMLCAAGFAGHAYFLMQRKLK